MDIVKLSDLKIGVETTDDYYSSNGEKLLSRGTVVTEKHIDLLTKRNHENLYLKHNASEEEELKELLSKEFDDLDAIDLGINGEEERDGSGDFSNLKTFEHIKSGEEGLEQLKSSPQAMALDEKFTKGEVDDKPKGVALKDSATEITPQERTDSYKKEITIGYESDLESIKGLLNSVARSKLKTSAQIRAIVVRLIKKFVTDKNILLNLSLQRDENDELYIYRHSLNVCLLSINIAASFGYSEEQIIEVGIGALLSDVGMLLVPKNIYLKKGRLTQSEVFEVQKHAITGLHLVENISNLPESVSFVVYQSHERENETGYPKKRGGRFIHQYAKIIQIADVFTALSSKRSYRDQLFPYKAMETIIKMTRYGLLNGEMVKSFLTYTSLFPVGSLVKLSTGSISKVIKANGTSFAKPVVTVLTDEKENILSKDNFYQIDLSSDKDIQITKALSNGHISGLTNMDGF